MPFPPSGTNSLQEEQCHYEVSRGDIARGFCLARMGGVPEVVLVMSQAEEDTLDSYALLRVFTITLQHFYGTFMTAWCVPDILCIVGQDKARGRSCRDTTPSTVAVGKHNHIAQESRLDDTG
jgi:hypothetical protein